MKTMSHFSPRRSRSLAARLAQVASVLALGALGVACSSASSTSSDLPPTNGSEATNDPTEVRAQADEAGRAAGVSWWHARLRQADDAISGALDLTDVPADDGRVAIEFSGYGANNAPVVSGVFALSTARLFALEPGAAPSDVAAMFSGTFVAHANADGSAGAPLDSVTGVALLMSLANGLSQASAPVATSSESALHLTGIQPKKALCGNAKLMNDLGASLAQALNGADDHCRQALLTIPTESLLSKSRPNLFGVNDLPPLKQLQQAHLTHVRGNYRAERGTCVSMMLPHGPGPNQIPKNDPQAAVEVLKCATKVVDAALAEYDTADPPIGVTLTIGNEILDGFQSYSSPVPPSTKTWAAYEAAWQTTACAIISTRASDTKHLPHDFELWNEPDGAAPLPPSQLVPMLSGLIKTVSTPGSFCYDPHAKFSLGAATTDYYAEVLQAPGGVQFVQSLAYYNLHPYSNWPGINQERGHVIDPKQFPLESGNPKGQSLTTVFANFAATIMSVAGTKPITLSEFGYNVGGGGALGSANNLCKFVAAGAPYDCSQCDGEAKEIAAFYQFMANPPASVAAVAASVRSADLYGWPRSECNGKASAAILAAATTQTTDPGLAACDSGGLGALVRSFRSDQAFVDYLCCAKALIPDAKYLGVQPAAAPACSCVTTDHGAKPFKVGGTCSACPDGQSVAQSVSGCGGAELAVTADSCQGKPDGWYCSQLVNYSAYRCTAGDIASGHQCAAGLVCYNTHFDNQALVDPTDQSPMCVPAQ